MNHIDIGGFDVEVAQNEREGGHPRMMAAERRKQLLILL